MTTLTKKQEEEEVKLEELAEELSTNREMREATLDGLEARISANISALENPDIDARMTAADNDVVKMAEDVLRADGADIEAFDADLAAADVEEDQLLEEDELPPVETAARLTSEESGIKE